MKNNFLIIFIFVFMFLFAVSPTYSENDFDAIGLSESYLNEGVQYFNKEQNELALESFLKVLCLNPENSFARAYMQRIIESNTTWPRRQRLLYSRFVELIDYYLFLNQRIESLNVNNYQLIQYLYENSPSDSEVAQQAASMQKRIEDLAKMIKAKPIATADQLETEGSVDQFNEALINRKKKMMSFLVDLQHINQKLRLCKIKIVKNIKSSRKQELSQGYDESIEIITAQLEEKELKIQEQKEQLLFVNDELQDLRSKFNSLQNNLSQMDGKIVGLTKDLAGMSLELFEKNKKLNFRDDNVVQLEATLREANERLLLAKYILQEKNEQLETFSQQIAVYKELESKSVGISPGRSMVANLKTDLSPSLMSENYDKINLLEIQIQDLSKKYQHLFDKIQDKDLKIAQMEQNLTSKDKKITNLKRVFLSRDRKLAEMNGILEIYKGKLQDAVSFMQQKELKLQYFQKRFQEIHHEKKHVDPQSYLKSFSGQEIVLNNTSFVNSHPFEEIFIAAMFKESGVRLADYSLLNKNPGFHNSFSNRNDYWKHSRETLNSNFHFLSFDEIMSQTKENLIIFYDASGYD